LTTDRADRADDTGDAVSTADGRAHEWIGVADDRGRLLEVNASMRAALALPADDRLHEVAVGELVDEDVRDEVIENVRTALAEEGAWRGNAVVYSLDRRAIEIEATIVGHPATNGEPSRYSFRAHDLTAARATLQAVDRSERQVAEAWFQSLVQHAPDLLAVVGADRRVIYASPSSERLLGYTPDELVGMVLLDLVVPDDREAVERFAPQLIERPGEPIPIEMRLRHRDGSIRAFEGSATNLLADPAVEGLVVNAREVTDHRAAEAARRRSEAALRAIVQSSPLAIIALDPNGLVHVWNRACEEMFGFPPSDAIGRRPPFLTDESTGAYLELVARAFTGETVRGQHAAYSRHDKSPIDVEIAIAPLRDSSQRIVTAVAVVADVTEQKRATLALRESEVRFRSLVQHSSDMVTVVDRDWNVSYMSPSAALFSNLDAAEVVKGRYASPTVAPEDEARVTRFFADLSARPGSIDTVTFRVERGDGDYRWVEMIANNLLDDPAVRGIVTNSRDITERKWSEEALRESAARLRESEARYRAIVNDQTELVCRYLPDTTLTFVNEAFAEFYGRSRDELLGSFLIDVFPEVDRAGELERLGSFHSGSEVQTYDDVEVAADGSRRWYRWTDRAFLDDDGNVVEFQSVGHDVTEERRAAALTAHQAVILDQVARGMPLEDTLRTISLALEDHFHGLSCAVSLLDDSILRLAVAPSLPRPLLQALNGMTVGSNAASCGTAASRRQRVVVADIESDPLWAEHRQLALDHGVRAAWSTPIFASDGRTVLGTLALYANEPRTPDPEHDRIVPLFAHLASIAIERKAFEDRLAHQSMHDPLTHLPNRLLFLDRLGLAIARCRRTRTQVAVVFLDLDRFKNVNDSLGHDAGDELLVAVARRLETMLRPGDTVARFGGDEFTILCEDLPAETSTERSIEIANRLLSSVSRPFVVRGAEIFVGASIGIAHATTGDERPEELLRDADAAMYHAKDAGRGRIEIFDDTMRARALARHATENALHRALERGELRVFFQPIIALADARCVGAEALVRWQHPERGLVPPAEFVPLAEETGLVIELGAWVLEEAARNAARWQLDLDGDFVVSVNLSARQLAQPDLVDRVAAVIEQTGVRPANLCFEITESVLMDDAAAIAVIERIRGLGVRFAIDDFGTGYSSLGYLRRFPVDVVKIDRAFVASLGGDPGDAAIVSAVIGLGHALGLRVVAEGVETEQQLQELVMLGCDDAQGYFFAPPQPVQDLSELMRRTRSWRPPGTNIIRG
jgi:diguanylate cyclase (GGDEF)-like protein/PAS domain S-box-containing protein